MTEATLLTKEDRPSVRLERQLVDPPPVVWRALTDREQLRTWFPCDVIVEGGHWKVGARISFVFGSEATDMTLSGEVLAVDEPTHLAFYWGEEILRFELTPLDGGTHLVLLDELPPTFAARNAAGWDVCLDRLQGIVPASDWKSQFDRYTNAFEPVLGPQEGPPTSHEAG
jgi:uncharacterized protein YndB with AHSA1/START domain